MTYLPPSPFLSAEMSSSAGSACSLPDGLEPSAPMASAAFIPSSCGDERLASARTFLQMPQLGLETPKLMPVAPGPHEGHSSSAVGAIPADTPAAISAPQLHAAGNPFPNSDGPYEAVSVVTGGPCHELTPSTSHIVKEKLENEKSSDGTSSNESEGDPSDLPADAGTENTASADLSYTQNDPLRLDCIHHIFDAASGMCAKAELERSRFVPDYEAINRAILDEYAPRATLDEQGFMDAVRLPLFLLPRHT